MHAQFRFEPLGHYPHLAYHEALIWDKFVRANPEWAQVVDYDVTVGEPDKVPEGTPDYTKKDWEYLRSWKIDAVAVKDGLYYIIEIRPSAGLGAIGEIISKASMYQEEHPDVPEVEAIIITDVERPNMKKLTADRDIGYIIV